MKPFHHHSITFLFTSVMAIGALAPAVVGEQPPALPPAQAESKKTPTPPQSKPQVIYHISRGDVAALHAQAKTQRNALPIDSSMPPSLQMSRAAANEAAAKAAATQQPSPSPNEAAQNIDPARNAAKDSRVRTNVRPQSKNSSRRVRGNGPPRNPHAQKSHKH
jgi:hypothetical protein